MVFPKQQKYFFKNFVQRLRVTGSNITKYKNSTNPCNVAVKQNKYENTSPARVVAQNPNIHDRPNKKNKNIDSLNCANVISRSFVRNLPSGPRTIL